ncbi:iron-containing redox enzyme family protein [Waterburya agarophytonicola K14]|jgi:hypothetical protein|uniref:Iron-containing redox enzyme family protein n=1 Tax=Waterburya agarophytonicola KI4 TaxID=2874699 RepID=A0A964BPG6_9CYAN|nr:iron-containing redox enzyme family protein [Waterburya agarophytonicola]MCC0177169.1 iron-containing redox enzyme family protein [Waterburya agarophytonicola KI4]
MANEANIGSVNRQVDNTGLVSESSSKLEWAQIAPGKVVVANSQRAWLYQPQSQSDRFARPMDCAGSFATTKKLLDTAIAAAKVAVKSDSRPPALTTTRWIWRLASAYHLTSPASRLFTDAAVGFAANGRSNLESWALEKVEEETGHDRLALLDIKSLGYDAEAIVEELKPPAAIALIDYFTRSVQDDDPIDVVGYAYTMERLSLGIEQDYIDKVESLIPPEINATRCLRVHSSIGADAGHANENVEVIAKLSASERTRIARACYETALMLFSPPPGGYISDDELQEVLEPLKVN